MARKKYKPEEIVAYLRQVDVLVPQGRSVAEAVRSICVTRFTGAGRLMRTSLSVPENVEFQAAPI